jgi:uncharacterized protein (DUF302 family)
VISEFALRQARQMPYPMSTAARYGPIDLGGNMKRLALASAILVAIAHTVPALAADDLVLKESKRDVKATIDALTAALEKAGIKIVARVDHAAAAQNAKMELRPTTLLIFGNPALGTPLMQSTQKIGLDLPMKVLAYTDDAGKTWIAYQKPDALKARHGISGKDDIFAKMTGALDKMTGAAAGN